MDEYRMIDGKDFADFVKGFLSFAQHLCLYIIAALKQYYITAAFVFILILCAGLFCRYRTTVYYEATMVCLLKEPAYKKTYGEMVHDLDKLAKSHSYAALSTRLKISPADAKQILEIEGKNSVGSMLYEDITTTYTPLYFTVKSIDNRVFPAIERALMDYINTGSPYLNEKVLRDSASVQARINYLNRNINVVDSVLASIYGLMKRNGLNADTSINANKFAMLLRYKTDMDDDLVKQTRRARDLKTQIELLHGFMPADNPVSSKNKILLLALAASLILPCIVVVFTKALRDGKNPSAV